MKRSEMLLKIEVWLDKTYLDHYLYNDSSAKELLNIIEEAGMLPPHTYLENCEHPELQVYVENIDVPHWIILGWDKE
jgi:hypothetical protein